MATDHTAEKLMDDGMPARAEGGCGLSRVGLVVKAASPNFEETGGLGTVAPCPEPSSHCTLKFTRSAYHVASSRP